MLLENRLRVKGDREEEMFQNWNPWISSGVTAAGAILLGLLIHFALFKSIERVSLLTRSILDDSFAERCRGPSMIAIPVLFVRIFLPFFALSSPFLAFLKQLLSFLSVSTFGALDIWK